MQELKENFLVESAKVHINSDVNFSSHDQRTAGASCVLPADIVRGAWPRSRLSLCGALPAFMTSRAPTPMRRPTFCAALTKVLMALRSTTNCPTRLLASPYYSIAAHPPPVMRLHHKPLRWL